MKIVETSFKIKDNKAIILNKINKQRRENGQWHKLMRGVDLDKLIQTKMRARGCSQLEATEILKQEVKDGILK